LRHKTRRLTTHGLRELTRRGTRNAGTYRGTSLGGMRQDVTRECDRTRCECDRTRREETHGARDGPRGRGKQRLRPARWTFGDQSVGISPILTDDAPCLYLWLSMASMASKVDHWLSSHELMTLGSSGGEERNGFERRHDGSKPEALPLEHRHGDSADSTYLVYDSTRLVLFIPFQKIQSKSS